MHDTTRTPPAHCAQRAAPSSTLLVLLATGALAGCYTTGQSAQAKRLVTMPRAPQGKCEALGELTGRSGGFFGAWYKDETLAESARNDLANQAVERGATHLQAFDAAFINNEAGRHDRAEVKGVAYKCTGQVTYGGEQGTVGAGASQGDWLCGRGSSDESAQLREEIIWEGKYVCSQGVTGLTLTTRPGAPGMIDAAFSFYALPENARVPTGSFAMTGELSKATNCVSLQPKQWIQQPAGYVMVALQGAFDAHDGVMRGKVLGPGCKEFELHKVESSPHDAGPYMARPALGVATEGVGCIPGQIYEHDASDALPNEYTDDPKAELWGCGFQVFVPANQLGFAGAEVGHSYVVRHQGIFNIPQDGEYAFTLFSRGLWRLTLDGGVVVLTENGQRHTVELSAGSHRMLLEYVYQAGAQPFSFSFLIAPPPPHAISVPFNLGRGSPYYAAQGIYYAGATSLGDRWRSLASLDRGASEIRINEQVNFKTDSDEIIKDGESDAVLYAVAKTLAEHPEIALLEVQGHTDDRGGAAHNLDLSRRRALAVRRWLIDAGVAPHRLKATGFGQTMPLQSNASEEGRAVNRRVQFLIKQMSRA